MQATLTVDREIARRFCLGVVVSALLISSACSSGPPPTPPQAQPPAQADVLVATVRDVDEQEQTFDVVTGTGLALRVEDFYVNSSSLLMGRGEKQDLAYLKSGDLVRVQYRDTEDGQWAERVEVLDVLDEGDGR